MFPKRQVVQSVNCYLLLTACGAMVTDDGQQVVSGDLGEAILGQERLEVESLQWEGHVTVDLEGVHHLMTKTLQVNAQNLYTHKMFHVDFLKQMPCLHDENQQHYTTSVSLVALIKLVLSSLQNVKV